MQKCEILTEHLKSFSRAK